MGTSKPEVEVITSIDNQKNTFSTAVGTTPATIEPRGRDNSDNTREDITYKTAQTTKHEVPGGSSPEDQLQMQMVISLTQVSDCAFFYSQTSFYRQ